MQVDSRQNDMTLRNGVGTRPPDLATGRRHRIIVSGSIALLLVVAAAALRFYKLGHWSFALDEVATLSETRALFDPAFAPHGSQTFRLPRLVPLGYLVSWASYSLFGADEFGSRVGPAFVGALMVGVVFLLSEAAFGRRTAVVIGLLVALSPAHIFQSQLNRFYSVAALFAGVTLLLGSIAAERPALTWTVLACACAVLSVLSHTVSIVLLPMVCVGVLATRFAENREVPRRDVLVFGVAGVSLCALFLFYVKPLVQGWNRGAEWGYSVGHSVLASVNILGWPLTLLAGLGLILMFEERASRRWYWVSSVCGWAAITVVLPLFVPYHAWYTFPFALSGLVLAGFATSDIYRRLRPTRPLASVVWLCVALGLNLPSVISHFEDGSRVDMRTAAHYVSDHWQPEDRVATVRIETFRYYAGNREPAFALPSGEEATGMLEHLAAGNARLWIVVDSTRGGLPNGLQRWLLANTSHRLHVKAKRLDYFENAMDVFVLER